MTVRQAVRTQIDRDLRLAILQLLAGAGDGPDRELPMRLLRSALVDLGHRPSADRQRSAVAWLEEQRLATSVQVSESVQKLRLTERGLDVAEGRATEPGVARPGPGDAV